MIWLVNDDILLYLIMTGRFVHAYCTCQRTIISRYMNMKCGLTLIFVCLVRVLVSVIMN